MSFSLPAIASTGSANGIATWIYGEGPAPDWVAERMPGEFEPNGTFIIEATPGQMRVHPGNVIIRLGADVWVQPVDEAGHFIESLKLSAVREITNVGPGKIHQFGERRTKPSSRRSAAGRHQIRFHPPVGSQPSIEWIHLERLSVDSIYQRSTDNVASERLIASIAAKFDWRLCAPLVVSRRSDDVLAIIDGQHRWMAAQRRGDILQLPCCIFRYGSREEEARMFILANRARKPMNRLDDYYAALAAADEDALEIRQLVTDAGLQIARNTSSTAWKAGEIAFTSSIAQAIRRHGIPITSAVLTNMAEAFSGQKLTHGGAIFGALIKLMSGAGPDFDPDILLDTLQSRTADEWGKRAQGLHGGAARARALYEVLLASYQQHVESHRGTTEAIQ